MLNDYLCYYDNKTEKSVYVCSQTVCNHTTKSCDAFFDFRSFRTENGLWYYDDKLYLIGTGDDYSEYALWSVNLDGSSREKITDLFKYEGENDYIYAMTIHRGYMYYALSNDDFTEPAELYQVELKKNAKPKVIYSTESETTTIYRFKGYGDGIFFQVGMYLNGDRENEENYVASVKYITVDGECYHVLSGPEKFYNIIDGKLFYTTNGEGIRYYDWKTDEDRLFIQTDTISNISFDANYIYLDNYIGTLLDSNSSADKRVISCYDYDGNMVHAMNVNRNTTEACIFGAEDYLWMWMCDNVEEPSEMNLALYEKVQITTAGEEWKFIEEPYN